MKRWTRALLSCLLLASLAACGKEPAVNTTNTLSPAILTPREQMLAGQDQDVFIYNYETDSTYKTVELTVEVYKNGKASDHAAQLQCALPQPTEKDTNSRGSLAIILGADQRFSVSVCDADGNSISRLASAEIQSITDATYKESVNCVSADTPLALTGTEQTLAYLVFGNEEKTKGSFDASVFLHPLDNVEQAAAFDRIYLVKGRFY